MKKTIEIPVCDVCEISDEQAHFICERCGKDLCYIHCYSLSAKTKSYTTNMEKLGEYCHACIEEMLEK